MSESKVRLQMVNVKYNYFRLHALYNAHLMQLHKVCVQKIQSFRPLPVRPP